MNRQKKRLNLFRISALGVIVCNLLLLLLYVKDYAKYSRGEVTLRIILYVFMIAAFGYLLWKSYRDKAI